MVSVVINKTAVITGATGGLGSELCRTFYRHGYDLILLGRCKKDLLNLQHDISEEGKGARVVSYVADLAVVESIDEIVCDIKDKNSRVDVVINNAAIQGPIGLLDEVDFKDFVRVHAVNFLSPVRLVQGLIPLLRASKGSVINISGGGATGPRPGFSAYGASKAALLRFTENFASEEKVIAAYAIAPGMMPTKLLREVYNAKSKLSMTELVEIEKCFTEKAEDNSFERVCKLAIYLSGDSGRWLSGKIISAVWDDWMKWEDQRHRFSEDMYTLRRITGRTKGLKGLDI